MIKTARGTGSFKVDDPKALPELKAEDVVWIGADRYIVTYDEQGYKILKRLDLGPRP